MSTHETRAARVHTRAVFLFLKPSPKIPKLSWGYLGDFPFLEEDTLLGFLSSSVSETSGKALLFWSLHLKTTLLMVG